MGKARWMTGYRIPVCNTFFNAEVLQLNKAIEMTALTRNDVFFAIEQERDHQDQKWGTLDEHPHELGAWLTIMRSLLNDAERAYMSPRGTIGALDELRKVVAVGVACMEQHGVPARDRRDSAMKLDG